MRDLLEKQLINDANEGDTTVLAELLAQLDDEVIFNALSDTNQRIAKREKEVQDIINRLKRLTDELDGETMQHILKAVGMEEQMLSQLTATTKGHTLVNRLGFIQGDIIDIVNLLSSKGVNLVEVAQADGTTLETLINNIMIACDLTDDESDGWVMK